MPADVLPDTVKNAIVTVQNFIDQTQKFLEIGMEIVDDLLNKPT